MLVGRWQKALRLLRTLKHGVRFDQHLKHMGLPDLGYYFGFSTPPEIATRLAPTKASHMTRLHQRSSVKRHLVQLCLFL